MRTLVIGIPLPHVTFDNYSFLSAPSFFDYPRMIVETAAVSRAVEETAAGSNEHVTFGGLPVVNGPSGPSAFGLADLLALRRREAERLLRRGGIIACFAHPDVPHQGIRGLEGWRRYDWLPEPEGFRFQEHLLPGFGRAGVVLEDPSHPFAPLLEEYGQRLAYRAYAAEDAPALAEGARVFARSPGGAAVGVELSAEGGRIVLLPPLERLDATINRIDLAAVLFRCLERASEQGSGSPPEWIRKEVS